MKKNDSSNVAAALATATCTLLGTAAPAPVDAQEDPGWDFNTALLYYGEGDERVQDLSLNALARRLFTDDRVLTLSLGVDALTGATPSGAIPFGEVQTFTRPSGGGEDADEDEEDYESGKGIYTVAPGEFPLDDTFRDTRVALSANWEQPLGRLFTANTGFSFSDEYDYTHMGVNAKLSRDFNKRNTTLSMGVAFASDDIAPVGGTPDPLTPMLDVGDLSNRTGDQSKEVLDVVFGVTQVVSRNLLAQLNYSFSDSSGYLTDPYKILTVVDPVNGDPIPRTPPPGVNGPSHLYLFESRPDKRTKHSLFGQIKYFLDGNVLDLSYRYMTDDWEIESHTLDARYRWPAGESGYLEPHLRYYTQSQADFYEIALVENDIPQFASADYRLGDFDAITAGLKYGWRTRGDNEMTVRLEYYRQDGDAPADQVFGNLASRDLYPDLDALIFQFSYKFGL